jgi:hypothetical protein
LQALVARISGASEYSHRRRVTPAARCDRNGIAIQIMVTLYEVLSTFWAAARTACGTDLRGQSLLNLDVLNSVPDGFVVELGSKLRPAGIEYGLGQAGSGKPERIDVTDTDALVLPHQPSGQPMLEMLATVRDLGVDGSHAGLAPGALGNGERLLVFAVEARRFNLLACGARGQGPKTQVDADFTVPVVSVFRDLDLQIEIPAAAGVPRGAGRQALWNNREPKTDGDEGLRDMTAISRIYESAGLRLGV